LRWPDRWGTKSFISIVTGALRSPESYQPTHDSFRLLADSLDMALGGQITRAESFLLQFENTKPKTVRMVREAFVRAGREAATQGRVTPETAEHAGLPLAPDDEHYRVYTNAYWETATRVFAAGGNLADVRDAVLCDPSILMREMARCVDPAATARVRAVLQFDLGSPERHYRITIDRGVCELLETTTERPDLRVRCEGTVWGRIFTRRLDVRSAMLSGQLRLEGDKTLFTRLARFFPPPSQ
jgi:putative sterol carrier protein